MFLLSYHVTKCFTVYLSVLSHSGQKTSYMLWGLGGLETAVIAVTIIIIALCLTTAFYIELYKISYTGTIAMRSQQIKEIYILCPLLWITGKKKMNQCQERICLKSTFKDFFR